VNAMLRKYLAPISIFIFALACISAAARGKSPAKSNVAGKWDLSVNTGDGGQEDASMELKVADDGGVTGTVNSHYGNAEITKGSADGDKFSIEFKLTIDNAPTDVTMRGSVDGDHMKGDGTAGDGTYTFTGTRSK